MLDDQAGLLRFEQHGTSAALVFHYYNEAGSWQGSTNLFSWTRT